MIYLNVGTNLATYLIVKKKLIMYNKIIRSFFLIAVFSFISFAASAQTLDQFTVLIKNGNATELAKYFQSNVEINTSDASNSYSKSQAEQVLGNFFKTHTPRNFTVAHQGTSPQGSKYIIGNLVTASGNYRVYLYAKSSENSLAIQEIRFEQQ